MTLFKLSTPIMEGRGAKGKIAQQTRTGYKLPLYFEIQGLCPTHYRGVL